jgi:hypothetical protein
MAQVFIHMVRVVPLEGGKVGAIAYIGVFLFALCVSFCAI